MLPYFNPTFNKKPCVWNRARLMSYMGNTDNSKNLKRLERLTKSQKYFPSLISPKNIRDSEGKTIKKNILEDSLSIIRKRRGKFLIIQLWSNKNKPTMICGHDGRGSRQWVFINNKKELIKELQQFIDLLSLDLKNPLLLLFHQDIEKFRTRFINLKNVKLGDEIYSEKYNIKIPRKLSGHAPNTPPSHLDRLEAESIHIIREVHAEAKNPVMLYSIGKDSSVMLHLARKAFWPGTVPFPLLHIDTGWKFQAMYEFKDKVSKSLDVDLITHSNSIGIKNKINPLEHGSALHTEVMKTQALKQALDTHGFDVAFGGARRDEEKSRSKERIFSFRRENHEWDPRNQRPELWNLYNSLIIEGESIRVFPLSNWTEIDIWTYIFQENISIVPLYFAAKRPVIKRNGTLILVDDDRLPLSKSNHVQMRSVRFRTLGCYPLTGAITSNASSIKEVILELSTPTFTERLGRTIDQDENSSMEKKKKEGYF